MGIPPNFGEKNPEIGIKTIGHPDWDARLHFFIVFA